MSVSRLAAATALLAERFPDAIPAAQRSWNSVATGVAELDRIFPSGGLQRGRLSAWMPAPGAAALLRAACQHTVEQGERVVWVDGSGLATGTAWRTGPVLVRPAGPLAALRATELLVRSGGFALVVLDGLDPETHEMVRLSRASHEGGTALVLLTRVTALATLRVASRALIRSYRWRRSVSSGRRDDRRPDDRRLDDRAFDDRRPDDIRQVQIEVEASAAGWRARTELALPVRHDDLRLALDSARPDRRGARR